MKKIAGVEFPAEMPVIEKYINVCTSEAKKVLDMYRKFTKSCEDKNIVNQEEINQKTDSNQSKRLLHSIYYDLLSSHYWTVENLEEKNQKALEQFKLYKDAARYDSINQNYIERTSIQSADQIEYQMMEICEMLLNKNFGGGGFGE